MSDPLYHTAPFTSAQLARIAKMPAFKFDFMTTWNDLPTICITRPFLDETDGTYLGRVVVETYDPVADTDGSVAVNYATAYFMEGFGLSEDTDHDLKVDCYRAATTLFRHGSFKNNVHAIVGLGYMYYNDRCEGRYLETILDENLVLSLEDIGKRAFGYFDTARSLGSAEAVYKLGDCYRSGRGTAVDLERSHELFSEAYDLARCEADQVWGSAALRIARDLELGRGCEKDLEEARGWYHTAVDGLTSAKRNGDALHTRALNVACSGLGRLERLASA